MKKFKLSEMTPWGRGSGSIARKVLLYILLGSSFVTLLVTTYQLYDDYKAQVGLVDANMVQIERSYRESIGNAIWFLNIAQIETILAGIIEFEDVHFVSVQIREGDTFFAGEHRPREVVRSISVKMAHRTQGAEMDVGRLVIESNLEGVITRLTNKFGVILVSQGIKTFVVSVLILFIIYYLVARHLLAISSFAQSLNIEEKEEFLVLDRSTTTLPDELDRIKNAMNQMKQDLINDAENRRQTEIILTKLKNQIEMERDYLREEVNTIGNFGEIVGTSTALRRTLGEVESVAKTSASVLILGESGVGKEMIARAIHTLSKRSDRQMVKVNCASIPNELFESEFFGHIKGSFTGAHQERVGRLQLADGGTLFLDEVGEIPLAQQGKLLRALQEGEFERVGENRTRTIDTRVVAATNRNLQEEIAAGRFREDLYYRLNVFPIHVPPLRERVEDIVPLALSFLEQVCQGEPGRELLTLTQNDAAALKQHGWPGNIRELKNTIERAVISSRGRKLELGITRKGGNTPVSSSARALVEDGGYLTDAEFRAFEKANITAALHAASWKIWGEGGAAALLGIKPNTLAYQVKKYGVEKI